MSVSRWRVAAPWSLLIFRLILGPVLLCMVLAGVRSPWLGLGVVAAFSSDWFDGVLARRFGTSTPALRRWDSTADVVFYLFVLAISFVVAGEQLGPWIPGFAGLICLEVACQALSWWKFRQGTSTHS